MPKFKSNSRFDLTQSLKRLGMHAAFDGGFSGISTADLKIKAVIHGGDIVVDERGTEAAAATAVIMDRSSRPSFVLKFDQPFSYMLYDRHTESILFMGRYVSPR